MNHLQLHEAALPDLSENQISRLAKDELVHFSLAVEQLQHWSEQMRQRINRAMEIRYAEHIRQADVMGQGESQRLRIDDGDLQIEMSQGLEVTWDQKHLAEIADRMVAAGDHVQDFMRVELSVTEADYARWHPMLKPRLSQLAKRASPSPSSASAGPVRTSLQAHCEPGDR